MAFDAFLQVTDEGKAPKIVGETQDPDFKGAFERGEGKNPGDESFYLLKGKLTRNNTDADKKTTSKATDVVFKSFPQDMDAPGRKPD